MKEQIRSILPRRIKPRRILRGPLRGTSLVTSWHDYPGALLGRTEAPLLKWLSQNVREGQTWLDIGAHYGYTAIAMCRLTGPSGRVLAFEPMLSTVGHLNETRRINGLSQLQIVPFALTDAAALTAVELPVERGMASPVTTQAAGMETIYAVGFDALAPTLQLSRVDGVKIDVQGFELETLRGMESCLRRNRPKLVLEFHKGVDRRAVLDFLSAAGYATAGQRIDLGTDAEGQYEDNVSYAFSPSSAG